MKIKSIFFLFALCMLASCSGNKESLTELIGNEAQMAMIAHPNQLMKDVGAKNVSDITSVCDKAGIDAELFANLKGLNLDEMALVEYPSAAPLAIFHVDNAGDLEKSLRENGFEQAAAADSPVYASGDAGCAMTVDGNVAYAIMTADAQTLAAEVKRARKEASKPLDQWKADALNGKSTLNAMYVTNDSYNMVSCDFERRKIKLHADVLDAHGKPFNGFAGFDYTPLDGNTDCLDSDALVSLAVAKADYASVMNYVPRGAVDSFTKTIITGILRNIAGPLHASLAFDGTDVESMQDYSLNVVCTATSDNAANDLVSSMQTGCKGMGFYVKDIKNGFTTRFEGCQADVRADGSKIKIATDHQIKARKPSAGDVKGALLWISVNLPVKYLKLMTDGLDAPVRASVKIGESGVDATAEVYDTDLSILDLVNRIMK